MPRAKGKKDTKPRVPRWDKGLSKEQKAAYMKDKGFKAQPPEPKQPEPTKPVFTAPEPVFTPPPVPEPPKATFTAPEPPEVDNWEDELNQYTSAEKENEDKPLDLPEQTNAPTAVQKYHISGAIALSVLNNLFPRGIVAAFRFFDERAKEFTYKEVQMDAEQLKEMTPLADHLAQIYLAGVSPLLLFFIMMGTTYMANMEAALSKVPKKAEK